MSTGGTVMCAGVNGDPSSATEALDCALRSVRRALAAKHVMSCLPQRLEQRVCVGGNFGFLYRATGSSLFMCMDTSVEVLKEELEQVLEAD
eukprot:5711472-Amphidinium_carterae.1